MTPQDIFDVYKKLVQTNSKLPTQNDLKFEGVSRDAVRHHFGSLTILHDQFKEANEDFLADYILDETSVFSTVRTAQLNEDLKKYTRFVVTTAVSGKDLNVEFYQALKSYCEKRNAKLIIIPCQDVISRKSTEDSYQFPVELREESFIHRDTRLNENLFISSIKLSAKHINPLTGLSRIGQRNGSYIYASPKQFLEYVVNSPEEDKIPHAIMTTGAITVNDYDNQRYMSQRVSYIAENDHVCGALIVEIEDEKRFHFRQLQADDTGSICDLGFKYGADGTVMKEIPHLVMGDLHAGDHDLNVLAATYEMIREMDIHDVSVHDAFSGYSVTHYDEGSPHKKAKKAMTGRNTFVDEVKLGCALFEEILSVAKGNIYRVKGNHDEWFERYLERGGYVYDSMNHYDALEYARYHLEGKEPLAEAYKKFMKPEMFERMVFLQRNDSHRHGGIELGSHGDKGLNGSKGSLMGMEKAMGDCVVGHTHSGAIYRSVYRVGTSTTLVMDYNSGPSSWTQTHCLVYSNGSRQLVNMLAGPEMTWKA